MQLIAATILLYSVLVISAAEILWPIELFVLIAILLLAGATRTERVLRALLALALTGIALLGLADFGTGLAFARPFNLIADWHFAQGIWLLLKGSAGIPLAVIGLSAVALVLAALMLGIWWSLAQWARCGAGARANWIAAAMLVPGAGLIAADFKDYAPVSVEAGARIAQTLAADEALEAFIVQAKQDPIEDIGPVLTALDGRDLIIIYIESYGRASFSNPRYRGAHKKTLQAIEEQLGASGLGMRSAFLQAPTAGGQSWLTHGSVASGLWLSDQSRYQAMLESGRQTLFDYAAGAGYRTVAVKPAHILAWPEGEVLGFEVIYNAEDLGYAGPALNWVTMPDQFTLAAFERLEYNRAGRPPILAEISLISSHAPWVPVPDMLAWEAVDDGTVYSRFMEGSPTPAEIWRDPERVRAQYTKAIEYSLQAVGSWVARHADNPPVVLLMGDHQPLPFVAESDVFDVPVHLIGPAPVVERLAGSDWHSGLTPGADSPVIGAERLRDWLLRGSF